MTSVLVVDDSAVDRRLAGGLLEKQSSVHVSYASDGHEALRQLEASLPDLVLTDLQMPEMTGLELVDAIVRRHPQLPVVLMTAQGSEQIAVEALHRGASSYVPKSSLAENLVSTVMNVLTVSRADDSYDRMMTCLEESRWSFVLDNDYTLIGPLVQLFRKTVLGMGLCDETTQLQVGIALEEALLNALYHGNLELAADDLANLGYDLNHSHEPNAVEERRKLAPYSTRKIHLEAQISRSEARFTVSDQGPGFDHKSLPDPMEALGQEGWHGRGLTHMRLFMDDVTFNEAGNQVTLVKRRPSSNGHWHGA
jgi:CheY-like chemotaxis protein/anti-sigma regulatory factor (Ser/Thr protein kinase)